MTVALSTQMGHHYPKAAASKNEHTHAAWQRCLALLLWRPWLAVAKFLQSHGTATYHQEAQQLQHQQQTTNDSCSCTCLSPVAV